MKRFTILVAALLVLSIALPAAQAATIMADSFDSYNNQTEFESNWIPIGTVAPISADLSTAQARSAPNSVEVDGTATSNQQRNQRVFTETGLPNPSQMVVWSFDFYDTAPAASPFRQYSNLQDTTAPSGTNQLIAMGMNNNQTGTNSGGQYYMARILGYSPTTVDPDGGPNESITGSGAFFKLNDFDPTPGNTTADGPGARSAGWHKMKVRIKTNDSLSTDYEFFIDGVLAERVSNVGTAASIRSYDNIRLGSGLSNGNNAAYFDNMRVNRVRVPEPATFVLASLAVLGLAGLSRRRAG
jgi:hypothetical protein